jgi:RNA polymerase-binding transcription factor DksA
VTPDPQGSNKKGWPVVVAKKSAAKKKATTKKTAAKKTAAKKAPAKKAPAKTAAKKTAAKKAPAKKAPAKAAAQSTVAKLDDAKAAEEARMAEFRKVSSKEFNKTFLKSQREILEAEREKYTRSAVSYKEEADSLVQDREPGDVQFDEESGEGDTLAVERERDLALSAQAQQAVDEIDAALARLDNGVYGVCVESGLPIPKERLEAIPWASQRVEYKVGGLGRR